MQLFDIWGRRTEAPLVVPPDQPLPGPDVHVVEPDDGLDELRAKRSRRVRIMGWFATVLFVVATLSSALATGGRYSVLTHAGDWQRFHQAVPADSTPDHP